MQNCSRARPSALGLFSLRRSWAALALLREVIIILAAALLYFAVRGLVDARVVDAYGNARSVIRFEQWLGIFHEPAMQRLVVPHDALVAVANWVYIWGHWPVIGLTLVWLHARHHDVYSRFRNAILISGAIGLIIFATFPMAPPLFMTDFGFWDSVSARSNNYRVLQPPSLVNKYAAMPSLHFGWNLLMGIAWASNATTRAGRVFGWLMPIAMLLAIVVTANHYFLDGVAGGALALVGLTTAGMVTARSRADVARPLVTVTARPVQHA